MKTSRPTEATTAAAQRRSRRSFRAALRAFFAFAFVVVVFVVVVVVAVEGAQKGQSRQNRLEAARMGCCFALQIYIRSLEQHQAVRAATAAPATSLIVSREAPVCLPASLSLSPRRRILHRSPLVLPLMLLFMSIENDLARRRRRRFSKLESITFIR